MDLKFFEGGAKPESDGNNGNCAICGEYINLDVHHILTRSKGGVDGKTIKICRKCHNWIHKYPAAAKEKGYLVKGYKINVNP